jgi:hypothetical protein
VLWGLHRLGLEIWFKGGTSLSKGFGLIQRFSEDLDLKVEPGTLKAFPAVGSWRSEGKRSVQERQAYFEALPALLVIPGVAIAADPAFDDPAHRSAQLRATYRSGHLAGLGVLRPFVRLEIGDARVTPVVPRDMASGGSHPGGLRRRVESGQGSALRGDPASTRGNRADVLGSSDRVGRGLRDDPAVGGDEAGVSDDHPVRRLVGAEASRSVTGASSGVRSPWQAAHPRLGLEDRFLQPVRATGAPVRGDRIRNKARATARGRQRVLPSDRARATELDRLIAEVVVDAYGETEQAAAFQCVLEEALDLPLQVEVGAGTVTVVGLELADDDRLVAICRTGRARRSVPLTELADPEKAPRGTRVLAAYLRWARGH